MVQSIDGPTTRAIDRRAFITRPRWRRKRDQVSGLIDCLQKASGPPARWAKPGATVDSEVGAVGLTNSNSGAHTAMEGAGCFKLPYAHFEDMAHQITVLIIF
jgi:hypothetical protein